MLVLRHEPRRAARKGPLDGPVEQPRTDPAADIGQRQAEEDEFVAAKLEIADQIAIVSGDVQFVPGLGQQRGEGGIGEEATLVPEPGPADAVVEVAVEGRGGRLHAFDRHVDVGRLCRAASSRPRTISRCVMVIGSRPSARGGG